MTTESENILRNVRNNAGLKFFALVLAIACWYLVREETSFEQTIHGIALDITPPEGWLVRSQSAAQADVLFRGSRGDIHGLSSENTAIAVDLRKAKPAASNNVRLSAMDVHAPAGVRALRVEPSAITVKLEKQ